MKGTLTDGGKIACYCDGADFGFIIVPWRDDTQLFKIRHSAVAGYNQFTGVLDKFPCDVFVHAVSRKNTALQKQNGACQQNGKYMFEEWFHSQHSLKIGYSFYLYNILLFLEKSIQKSPDATHQDST